MNKILLSLLLVVGAMSMNARQLSEDEALLKASNFGNTLTKGVHLNSIINKGTTLKLEYVKKVSDQNLFYVFNKGENQGYVIVSGDDRANEILGYSDEGTFDVNNLPENMKSWLEVYSEDLQVLAQNPDMQTARPLIDNTKEYAKSVSPLLGTLAWNQDSPYNDLCPVLPNKEKSAAGCVATAVSQVMYYHQWPARGTGSNSYTSASNRFSLTANFDTNYEWRMMKPTYNSSSTTQSRSAVAKLVYHVGVAFNMDYAESSGAFTRSAPEILRTYFKYDKGMHVAYREHYELNDWVGRLKNELNENRVFIYSGQSAAGGHAFVCDGYDENNMFHINWGWGGSSNGYFQPTALTPSTHGIGGGSADGFNRSQFVVVGIQKETPNPKIEYGVSYESISTQEGEYDRNVAVPFNISKLFNISQFELNNQGVGFGLYRDGHLITPIGMVPVNLSVGYGYNQLKCNVMIPDSFEDGEYQIYPILLVTDTNEYIKARSTVGDDKVKYINVTVGNTVKYSSQTNYTSALSLSNLAVSKMFANRESEISFDLTNTGAEYYKDISAKLLNDKNQVIASSDLNLINVKSGETQKVIFGSTFNIAQGSYKLAIYDYRNVMISSAIAITVNEEPADAVLTVASAINFADNNNVPKNKVQLTAKIKNAGGYHAGKLVLVIFNPNTGYSVALIESKSATIDTNQTCDVVFDGTVSLDNDMYLAVIYAQTSSGLQNLEPSSLNRVYFTLTDAAVGVESVDAVKTAAYPNPVIDVVNISCEKEMNTLRIFDITGRFVGEQQLDEPSNNYSLDMSTLDSGNYFIQVVTADGVNVVRVIKK